MPIHFQIKTPRLPDVINDEITRVRELVSIYKGVPNSQLAVTRMRASIARAEEALKTGGVEDMLRAAADLKGYKQ